MVKYALLQKRTVSNWPIMPRQLKVILALGIILVVSFIIISATSRNRRIAGIYKVQASLADVLDVEMKYMRKRRLSKENEWLPIEDLDGHVYSAYLDMRPEVVDKYRRTGDEIPWAVIRMIAILPLSVILLCKKVDCIYKHEDSFGRNIYKRRRATALEPIAGNWGLQYSAFFAICDVLAPDNSEFAFNYNNSYLPESVAIALDNIEAMELENRTRFVNVRYPAMGMSMLYDPPEKFMAVCVPVFHHAFDRPLDVVEFVEYYMLLGASHFNFYNSSVSQDVHRVLRYYEEREIATILAWKLPSNYIFERTLRHEGLYAGLNDCLYRNSFYESYEYTAIFGIDEFLVPRIHNNFVELMRYLNPGRLSPYRHASFLFRNGFFYTMYEDDAKMKFPNKPYLHTQKKISRVAEPDELGRRSRYLVRGRDAIELGSYKVRELRRGLSDFSTKHIDEVAVNPDVALSHNYAPCEAEETACYLKRTEIDRSAQRFAYKLGPKVAATCDKIFGSSGCPIVKNEPLA